jgi:hypothetical protein
VALYSTGLSSTPDSKPRAQADGSGISRSEPELSEAK